MVGIDTAKTSITGHHVFPYRNTDHHAVAGKSFNDTLHWFNIPVSSGLYYTIKTQLKANLSLMLNKNYSMSSS